MSTGSPAPRDFLGKLPVTGEPERDGMDPVGMSVTERHEGLLRAAGDRPDKPCLAGHARAMLH